MRLSVVPTLVIGLVVSAAARADEDPPTPVCGFTFVPMQICSDLNDQGWVLGLPGDNAFSGQWERTDPLGTATIQTVGAGLGAGDAFLRFAMPPGTDSYDAWVGFPTGCSFRISARREPLRGVGLRVLPMR